MLDGKSFSARVDFCTKGALPSLLRDLAQLHTFNVTYFSEQVESFYVDIHKEDERLAVLAPELHEWVSTHSWSCGLPWKSNAKTTETVAMYFPSRRSLSVYLAYGEDQLKAAFAK
jgi:hypothetical protein